MFLLIFSTTPTIALWAGLMAHNFSSLIIFPRETHRNRQAAGTVGFYTWLDFFFLTIKLFGDFWSGGEAFYCALVYVVVKICGFCGSKLLIVNC